jgi:hypothetical protein
MVVGTFSTNSVGYDIIYEELQCGSVHKNKGILTFLILITVLWILAFTLTYRLVIVKFNYESGLLHHCIMYLTGFKCLLLLITTVGSGVCQS